MTFFGRIVLILLAVSLAACASTETLNTPTNLTLALPRPATTTNAPIVLVVSPELRGAKWEGQLFKQDTVAPLGAALEQYARAMLSTISSDVRTADSVSAVPGARHYVIPSIKRVESSNGMWAGSQLVFTMSVEWRVVSTSGQLEFDDTIVGEGLGKMGNYFDYKELANETLGKLMQDTFAKSGARLGPVLSK